MRKMNSLGRFFLLLLMGAGFASCTEEVDLYSKGQPVPIVYGLLDPGADMQYIRVGRSFIGGHDAMNHPPDVDSTVWNIAHEVYVEEYTDGQKGKTFRFEPDNIIQKDSGFFPVANLRIYSCHLKPVAGRSYHLYVYFPDLNKMVSATTIIHGTPQILDPLPLSIRKINFETGQPFTIRWFPGLNTGVYDMIFRIHYRDSSAMGEGFNTADYSSGGIYNLETDQIQEYGMGGPSFFSAMASEIPVVAGVVREVISLEFIMIAGGTDLGIHYRSGLETGTNFTNLMEYSNIGNGIGVFSSRSLTRVPNLSLSPVTIDLLAQSEKTAMLGFKDSKGN